MSEQQDDKDKTYIEMGRNLRRFEVKTSIPLNISFSSPDDFYKLRQNAKAQAMQQLINGCMQEGFIKVRDFPFENSATMETSYSIVALKRGIGFDYEDMLDKCDRTVENMSRAYRRESAARKMLLDLRSFLRLMNTAQSVELVKQIDDVLYGDSNEIV